MITFSYVCTYILQKANLAENEKDSIECIYHFSFLNSRL